MPKSRSVRASSTATRASSRPRARSIPKTDEFNYTGGALPLRSSEALIEVTYQAQIIPGWTVQPDFQYVFRPGGNVSNPRDPNGTAVKDTAIFGLRTTIRY